MVLSSSWGYFSQSSRPARLGSIIVTLEFLRASHFPHFPHWIFIPVFLTFFLHRNTAIVTANLCALKGIQGVCLPNLAARRFYLHEPFNGFYHSRGIGRSEAVHRGRGLNRLHQFLEIPRGAAVNRWPNVDDRLLSRPLDVERVGMDKAFPLLRISPTYQTIKMITQILMPIRISISITSWTNSWSNRGLALWPAYSRPATASASVFNLILEINREFAFRN